MIEVKDEVMPKSSPSRQTLSASAKPTANKGKAPRVNKELKVGKYSSSAQLLQKMRDRQRNREPDRELAWQQRFAQREQGRKTDPVWKQYAALRDAQAETKRANAAQKHAAAKAKKARKAWRTA